MVCGVVGSSRTSTRSRQSCHCVREGIAEWERGGEDGERYSESIKANAADGPGDPSWPEWHRNWVAVRTAEIDARCAAALDAENRSEAATITQVVNLGAGLDARAFRGLGRRANVRLGR